MPFKGRSKRSTSRIGLVQSETLSYRGNVYAEQHEETSEQLNMFRLSIVYQHHVYICHIRACRTRL
jgi:hypothetical protein